MWTKNWKIFRVFGIDVKAHWTWLLLAFLIASSLAGGWFPVIVQGAPVGLYWLMGIIGAIGLFVSIILHELSHALVGRHYKMGIKEITLFLFGGVAHMEDEPPSPKAEFLMAIAGPAMSVVLAGVFWSIYLSIVGQEHLVLWAALLSYLATINIAVAIFNMLPGFPLDGGRVLRSILWGAKNDIVWATRIASTIGQFFGVALIGLGLAAVFSGDLVSGLWFGFLGLLLMSFARESYSQLVVRQTLHGQPAANFMNPHPRAVTPETFISDLMQDHFSSGEQGLYPVVSDDQRFLGCVDINRVKSIPEPEWPSHRVRELVMPCEAESRIAPEADAEVALRKMSRSGRSQLIVLEGDRLVGTISYQRLLRYLNFRMT